MTADPSTHCGARADWSMEPGVIKATLNRARLPDDEH
jgi:hypothetical protein